MSGPILLSSRFMAARPRRGRGTSRHAEMGARLIVPTGVADATLLTLGGDAGLDDYAAHRIALGLPEGGVDFAYGDAFPAEADMDLFNGVDFKKGCFVGQEVVARMHYRSTTRTRVTRVLFEGAPPAPGAPVTAGEKSVGTMGSSAGGVRARPAAARPRRRGGAGGTAAEERRDRAAAGVSGGESGSPSP